MTALATGMCLSALWGVAHMGAPHPLSLCMWGVVSLFGMSCGLALHGWGFSGLVVFLLYGGAILVVVALTAVLGSDPYFWGGGGTPAPLFFLLLLCLVPPPAPALLVGGGMRSTPIFSSGCVTWASPILGLLLLLVMVAASKLCSRSFGALRISAP